MNCLAPGFQMAGTVSTHRILLGRMVTIPAFSVINLSIFSDRYSKAKEKMSIAGKLPPLIAEILWFSLNA